MPLKYLSKNTGVDWSGLDKGILQEDGLSNHICTPQQQCHILAAIDGINKKASEKKEIEPCTTCRKQEDAGVKDEKERGCQAHDNNLILVKEWKKRQNRKRNIIQSFLFFYILYFLSAIVTQHWNKQAILEEKGTSQPTNEQNPNKENTEQQHTQQNFAFAQSFNWQPHHLLAPDQLVLIL
ncbi:hypothetical protein ACJX0J_027689 [Zea mays]